MKAVDLALGEPLLGEDLVRQNQGALVGLGGGVAHLPLDVPHDPARHALQRPEHALGPAVLLGLGMTAVLAEGLLHQLAVALAQDDPFLPWA
jgi:hypothetical protein